MKTESVLKHCNSRIHPVVAKLALRSGRIYPTRSNNTLIYQSCNDKQLAPGSLSFTAEFTEPSRLHTCGTIHLYLSNRRKKQ